MRNNKMHQSKVITWPSLLITILFITVIAPSATLAADPPALMVMSLNARKPITNNVDPDENDSAENSWAARKKRIARMIFLNDAHVVAMTELETSSTTTGANSLAIELANLYGTGRWDYREVKFSKNCNQYLAVFWRVDRVEILAKNHLLIPVVNRISSIEPGTGQQLLPETERCPYWFECVMAWNYNRDAWAEQPTWPTPDWTEGETCASEYASFDSGIQVLRLRDKQNQRAFYIYNNSFPSTEPCERAAMAAIAANYVNGRSYPSLPVVFAGDL